MSNSEFQLMKLSHHSCKICAYELLLNLKKNVQIGNCLGNSVLGENWSNNRLAPHLGLLPVWEILDPPLVHIHKNFLSWQKMIKHQSQKYSKILVLTIYLQPRAFIHPAGRALTSDWSFWLEFNWFDSERFSARQIVASNWFRFHWFSCLIHSSSFVMVVYENFFKAHSEFFVQRRIKIYSHRQLFSDQSECYSCTVPSSTYIALQPLCAFDLSSTSLTCFNIDSIS